MAHIVAEPCIKCKFTDCVAVCPVDCFHEGANFLVIDPDTCIDCGLCIPECPAKAIFTEDELPEKWSEYVEINAKYAAEWPVIDAQKEPLPDAEQFKEVANKRHMLDPRAADRRNPVGWICADCLTDNPALAQYCRQCGQALQPPS